MEIPTFRWLWRAAHVRTIDGDSIVFVIDRGFRTEQTEYIRVLGVNCPELVGASAAAGRAARDFTEAWISIAWLDSQWPFILETHKPRERDSFGRWLASVWRLSDGHSLADDLIAAGHNRI